MRKVTRDDLLDLQQYEQQRPDIRAHILGVKAERRVHAGDHLTFLFENTETIRYQVLEMIRSERLVADKDIEHELRTYNELIGGDGELGCTLLIEIEDPGVRAEKLVAWRALPDHLYLRLADGSLARAQVDERQRDDQKLSAVQFLKFDCGSSEPVAVGADLPALTIETPLDETQRAALAHDLGAPAAP
jgi:hypothetical protein